jgi:hypothetical protein
VPTPEKMGTLLSNITHNVPGLWYWINKEGVLRDANGETLFHTAARTGRLFVLRQLMSQWANPFLNNNINNQFPVDLIQAPATLSPSG